jgi:hypothetical protein
MRLHMIAPLAIAAVVAQGRFARNVIYNVTRICRAEMIALM